ncbi:hypothetical protein ACJQWK_05072 [Exserohilum turcicum]
MITIAPATTFVNKISPYHSGNGADLVNGNYSTKVNQQIDAKWLAYQVQQSSRRLSGHVVRTPTIRLPWLDRPGLEVWAKLDCHQNTGSFKYRGALIAIMQSPAETIVTASAGNHALAVCAAAQALEKEYFIIAPVEVSEIKAKRILCSATRMSFFGNDLGEATQEAIGYAKGKPNTHYISPYADPLVVAGAGTCVVEACEDAGPFDQVVVPLDGGGLASAVASWCSEYSKDTRVVCVHPHVFGRTFGAHKHISSELWRPAEASYCDGLAVQLVQETPLGNILDSLTGDVVQVNEDEVAIGIAQAMRNQSLLLEGSAAAVIAAIPQLQTSTPGPSRVLLLLTGSNIAANVVARALVTHVSDDEDRRSMGLRNIVNPAERYGALSDLAGSANNSTSKAIQKFREPRDIFIALGLRLLQSVDAMKHRLDQSRLLCNRLQLRLDTWSHSIVEALFSQVRKLTVEFCDDVAGHVVPFWVIEERHRVLLRLLSAASCTFERASPSYDQAVTQWFSDTASQNSNMALRPSEHGKTAVSLLLTSSVMAAFQILLHYFMQHIRPGDHVLLPPHIYFEASEEIKSFANTSLFHLHQAESFDAESLISEAEQCNARVVFIDPIANTAGLPTTDIRYFAQTVSHQPGWENRTVIIDGTMVSGGLPIYDWFVGPHAPLALYSERASKYPQYGLDVQMAGFVVYPSHPDKGMRKIRRDLGSVMYYRRLSLFAPLDYTIYQARLAMLTQNCETLCSALVQSLSSIATVEFPRAWSELGWRHGGSIITIEFHEKGLNGREGLDACIELVIFKAKQLSLAITKGVSFGFSTSRISASSSMAENMDPFLRISVGVEREHVPLLDSAVSSAVLRYHEEFSQQRVV